MFAAQSTGNAVLASADIGASRKAELKDIPKGSTCVYVYAKAEGGFYAWVRDVRFDPFDPETIKSLTLNAADANIKIEREAR